MSVAPGLPGSRAPGPPAAATPPLDPAMTVLPCRLTPVPAPPPRLALRPIRRAVASAPMRVSLAGGGTDLPPFLAGIGGRVVGTAVDLRVRALAEPFDRGWVRLELSATGLSFTRRQGEPRSRDTSARLLEETLSHLNIGEGVRLRVETELVPGTGLGGSAAAAVAALAALEAAIDHPGDAVLPSPVTMGTSSPSPVTMGTSPPNPEALALAAIRVERDGLGIAGGSQDQIFAACGGMLDLRFGEGGLTQREVVAVAPSLVEALTAGLLLVDTGRRRVSGEVIDRSHASPAATAELIAAAGDVAAALREGSLPSVLAGMRRSSAAKAARDPDANAGAVALAEILSPLGAEVVRTCGAGGGGHVLVWAAPDRHPAIFGALGGATVRRPAPAAPGVRLEDSASVDDGGLPRSPGE
jgi:D-glycero-alpha-D-manno-heptose-7-phosphate kinase